MSGRRVTKVQTTTRPDRVWPEVWIKIGKAAQNRAKQEWKKREPKTRQCSTTEGIYFIDPDDRKYKETFKTCEKKIGQATGNSHAVKKGDSDLQQETGCGPDCISQFSKDSLWLHCGIP